MAEIDDWADLLSEEMRAVWPVLGEATRRMGGSLVGGTALTTHLRHRVSFDLDFMTPKSFSGDRLAPGHRRNVRRRRCVQRRPRPDARHCARRRGAGIPPPTPRPTARLRQDTAEAVVLDGMRVASMADLLAMKLDVIMYRPKVRDYVDLAALDTSSPYSIEDGLLFHMRRYGATPANNDLDHIVALLDEPGQLHPDPAFATTGDNALDYLKSRVPDLRRHLEHLRPRSHTKPAERLNRPGCSHDHQPLPRRPRRPPAGGSAASRCPEPTNCACCRPGTAVTTEAATRSAADQPLSRCGVGGRCRMRIGANSTAPTDIETCVLPPDGQVSTATNDR